jgi:DNA-binding transcriptional LysR family regulator
MLNFNQLRVFCQTARYLSCTKAAEKLYITQPAVTAQVKLLEDSCNLKLFKKKGRRIFLTDEGKTLYNYAAKVFEYEQEIESVIEEMKELKRGVLRLGTTKAYARYFMPFLITSFRDAYPHIKINLDEGSSLDMVRSLIDLKNEVALISKTEDNADIRFIPFSQEELVLITAPGHRLTRRKSVSAHDLREEPIIMKERGSGTRKRVNELFAKKGLTANILMETSNTEFIKQVVQRGDGVSFVVREAVATEIQEGKLASVPMRGQKVYLDVSIAYLKDQHLSPPAHAFLDLLLNIAEGERPYEGIRTIMASMLSQWK